MKHLELQRLQEAAGVGGGMFFRCTLQVFYLHISENIVRVISLEISRNIISIITSILDLIILTMIFPKRYIPNLSINIWDLTWSVRFCLKISYPYNSQITHQLQGKVMTKRCIPWVGQSSTLQQTVSHDRSRANRWKPQNSMDIWFHFDENPIIAD